MTVFSYDSFVLCYSQHIARPDTGKIKQVLQTWENLLSTKINPFRNSHRKSKTHSSLPFMNAPKMSSLSTSCRALYRQKLHLWSATKSGFGLSLERIKQRNLSALIFFLLNLVIKVISMRLKIHNSYTVLISLPVDKTITICQHIIFCANSLIFLKVFTLTTHTFLLLR